MKFGLQRVIICLESYSVLDAEVTEDGLQGRHLGVQIEVVSLEFVLFGLVAVHFSLTALNYGIKFNY